VLKQRVITAVLLLAVLLPALFYPSPEPWAAITLLFMVGAGWEWARLNGVSAPAARVLGLLLGLGLGLLWWLLGIQPPQLLLWGPVALLWCVLMPLLLRAGVGGWTPIPQGLRLWLGLALIGLAWWAVVQARYLGIEMLLSILALVWMADIAAYFGGKALGRRKLAPQISPGKSWEGALSGALGVTLLGIGWWLWSPTPLPAVHLYAQLWAWGPALALLALWGLVAMSVAGDLVESLVKRSAGVKDSSALLPGHGGVLDRIDALLPVLPLAMCLLSL
jgi:phosphatidate cytidylyltransferase